jgi:hypothetical protein
MDEPSQEVWLSAEELSGLRSRLELVRSREGDLMEGTTPQTGSSVAYEIDRIVRGDPGRTRSPPSPCGLTPGVGRALDPVFLHTARAVGSL